MTGFPSVDVRSIGAGGGSIGWVDRGGLLHVGPQSAGASPGPVCWGRGGTRPTVTDACAVLGYLDPDYFLGGTMPIHVEPAAEAIMRDVGTPLGLDLKAAAQAIFQLACERMVTAIEEITLKQGIDARAAVLIGGGGGAGLYSATIARRLGVDRVVIPAVAAALSAAGALLSDLTDDFVVTAFTSTRSFDLDLAARTLADLRARAEAFIAGPGDGATDHAISFSVEARYPNQVWEIEVPLPDAGLPDAAAVAAFRESFHRFHDDLFAVSDPTSEVEIVSWRAHVRCGLPRTAMDDLRPPADDKPASTRRAYFPETGEVDTVVRRYGSLANGDRIEGPVIVESDVTTVVVPPGAAIAMLPSGSLLLEPFGGSAVVGRDLAQAA